MLKDEQHRESLQVLPASAINHGLAPPEPVPSSTVMQVMRCCSSPWQPLPLSFCFNCPDRISLRLLGKNSEEHHVG